MARKFFTDIKSESMYYDGVGMGAFIALIIVIPISCCCFMGLRRNNLNTRKINDLRAQYNASGAVAHTAVGPIEYYREGQAPYLLYLHGTPGCHDGVFHDTDKFVKRGFGVIAPSRPGYGRSTTCRTYPKQAEAINALLDTLDIK